MSHRYLLLKTFFFFNYHVRLRGDGPAVSLEPVQLPQHGPGRRAVFVRQVEDVGQQLQVSQGQGLCGVERVLPGSGNIGALPHVRLHGLLARRLLLETGRRTTAAWKGEEEEEEGDDALFLGIT